MQNFLRIIFLALIIASSAFAEQKNEIPLYGDQPKTKEEKASDEKFIHDVTIAAGTKEKACNEFLKRGWEAYLQGNLIESIKRYNEAWLLNPNDYNSYWGLGTISGVQGKIDLAIRLFEKGYQLKPKDPRFLSDYGFAYVNKALTLKTDPKANEKVPALLNAAADKYQEAIKIDSKASLPYARLAVLDYYRGDFATAWKNVGLSQQNGGEGLDPRFLSDLEKASPKPK